MRANAPTDGRKRRRLQKDVESFLEGLLGRLLMVLRLRDRHQHLSDSIVVGALTHTRRRLLDELRPQHRILSTPAGTSQASYSPLLLFD
jgi:hypothetical protein